MTLRVKISVSGVYLDEYMLKRIGKDENPWSDTVNLSQLSNLKIHFCVKLHIDISDRGTVAHMSTPTTIKLINFSKQTVLISDAQTYVRCLTV